MRIVLDDIIIQSEVDTPGPTELLLVTNYHQLVVGDTPVVKLRFSFRSKVLVMICNDEDLVTGRLQGVRQRREERWCLGDDTVHVESNLQIDPLPDGPKHVVRRQITASRYAEASLGYHLAVGPAVHSIRIGRPIAGR